MISYLTQQAQWYKHFETLPLDGQYEMFLELLEQNIPESELCDDSFVEIAIELKSDLIREKQYEQAIDLIEGIKVSTPMCYQQEFPYLSDFAVEYYLYTKDFEKMHGHLQSFITNPDQNYDLFLSLYSKIRFYRMDELAVNLANELYEPIAESYRLIDNAEMELVDVIFYNLFQEFYQAVEKNEDIPSLQQLENTLRKFDFDDRYFDVELPRIHQSLSAIVATNQAPMFTSNDWNRAVQDNSKKAIRDLFWSFAVYMLKKRSVHFSISMDIWFPFSDMLLRNKSITSFKFQYKSLDDLIGEFFSLFGNREEKGLAILWGIPFIYDFLHEQQLIPEETHNKALEHVAAAKEHIFKLYRNDIWRFDFVHEWGKPLAVDEESFSEEEEYFRQTFMSRNRIEITPSQTSQTRKKSDQLSLFDDLFGIENDKQPSTSTTSKANKKKKRKQANKQRSKNRKK